MLNKNNLEKRLYLLIIGNRSVESNVQNLQNGKANFKEETINLKSSLIFDKENKIY